jgi:hypothetical protein
MEDSIRKAKAFAIKDLATTIIVTHE